MIMDIPFVFSGRFVEPRKRIENTCVLSTSVAVRLARAEPGEVELAFAVADLSDRERGLRALPGGRARRVIRQGGRFLRELMPERDLALVAAHDWREGSPDGSIPPIRRGDDPEDEANREALQDAWEASSLDNPFAKHGRSPYCDVVSRAEAEAGCPQGIREWRDDGGATVSAKVREAAVKLLVVSGIAFQECPEPCWIVEAVNRYDPDGVTADYDPARDPANPIVLVRLGWAKGRQEDVAAVTHAMDPGFRPRGAFSLGRRDDAVRFASALASSLGVRVLEVRVAAAARVLRAGADSLPDDCLALEAAAAGFLKCFREYLPQASRAAVASWHRLRDAAEAPGFHERIDPPRHVYDARPPGGPPGDSSRPQASPALAEALAAAASAWSRFIPDPYQRRMEEALGNATSGFTNSGLARGRECGPVISVARLALGRWDERPADGREWTHMAGPAAPEGDGMRAVEITTLRDARALGARFGVNLEAEAAAAADGRCRIVAVMDGSRLAGAFEEDAATGAIRALGAAEPRPGAAEAARALSGAGQGPSPG